jgi:chemotaxis regulatin CheY-phosphate phosphatase CheZ
MQDLTPQVVSRLLNLIEQVKQDQTACATSGDASAAREYQHLFDSLRATLHNLTKPAEAAGPDYDPD